MDFNELQEQMRNQAMSGKQDSSISDAAKEMSTATQNMSQATFQQLQQSNAIISALQQSQNQIQSLSMNVQALTNSQRNAGIMQPSPQQPMPAMSAPPSGSFLSSSAQIMSSNLKQGAIATAGLAGNAAHGALNYSQAMNARYNPFLASSGQQLDQSLYRQSFGNFGSNAGFAQAAYGIFGSGLNASKHQSIMGGQMIGAFAGRGGDLLSDTITGGANMFATGNGLFTGESMGRLGGSIGGGIGGTAIGATIGGALLGPLGAALGGFAGGYIGGEYGGKIMSRVGGAMDLYNPVLNATRHANNTVRFGSNASVSAHHFLGGQGTGSRLNTFSRVDEAKIGSAVNRMAFQDYGLTSDDMANMQTGFAQRGLMNGTRDVQSYKENFKKRMMDAREIMKLFNTSLEEAMDFMEKEYSVMGMSARSTGFRTKMMAGASMTGKSIQDVAGIAAAGSTNAVAQGMTAGFGANMALQSATLASSAYRNGNITDIASLGGKEGLANIIQRSGNQFMQGIGGALIGLRGGQGFGGDIFGAMGNLDLTNKDIGQFLARGHKAKDMSAEQVQTEQFLTLKNLSKRFKGTGMDEKDIMIMLAKNQYNLNSQQAEGLVNSFEGLEGRNVESYNLQSRARGDLYRDQVMEHNSLTGRMERGFRNFSGTKGLMSAADSITGFAARVGDAYERTTDELAYSIYGGRTESHHSDTALNLMDRVKKGTFDASGIISSESLGGKNNRLSKIKRRMRTNIDGMDRIKEEIKDLDPSNPEDMHRLKQLTQATVGNQKIESSMDLDLQGFRKGGFDVSKREMYETLRAGGSSREQLNKFAEANNLGSDMGGVLSQKDFANEARSVFGIGQTQEDVSSITSVIAGGLMSMGTLTGGITYAAGGVLLANKDAVDKFASDNAIFGNVARDEDLLRAGGSTDFRTAMKHVDAITKLYKQNETWDSQMENNPELRKAVKSLKAIYARLRKDPKSKEVFDKILAEKNMDMSKADLGLGGIEGSTKNLFGENFSSEVDKLGKDSQEMRDYRAVQTGFENVFGAAAGDNLSYEDINIQLKQLGQDQERLDSMMQKGGVSKMIAKKAKQVASGGSVNMREMEGLLASSGDLGGSIGVDGMPSGMLDTNKEILTNMQKQNEALYTTLEALRSLKQQLD